MDYELLGFAETGIDLIRKLGLASQAVLVTSRFEEKTVLDRCIQSGIAMIPKGMVSLVPMAVNEPSPVSHERIDAVLLDDDPLVHLIWKTGAKESGVKLEMFSNVEELMKNLSRLSLTLPFYVDESLGNGVRGQDVCKQLFELGYNNLFIASGCEPEKFAGIPYIRGVQGKDPPF